MSLKRVNIHFQWYFTYKKGIVKTLDKSDLISLKMHIFQKDGFPPTPIIYMPFVNKFIDPHRKKYSLFRNVSRMKQS